MDLSGMRKRFGEGSTMRNFIICTVHLIYLSLLDKVKKIEMGRSCSQNGGNAFIILTSTFIGKGPLGRPRRGWEVNIRMDFK